MTQFLGNQRNFTIPSLGDLQTSAFAITDQLSDLVNQGPKAIHDATFPYFSIPMLTGIFTLLNSKEDGQANKIARRVTALSSTFAVGITVADLLTRDPENITPARVATLVMYAGAGAFAFFKTNGKAPDQTTPKPIEAAATTTSSTPPVPTSYLRATAGKTRQFVGNFVGNAATRLGQLKGEVSERLENGKKHVEYLHQLGRQYIARDKKENETTKKIEDSQSTEKPPEGTTPDKSIGSEIGASLTSAGGTVSSTETSSLVTSSTSAELHKSDPSTSPQALGTSPSSSSPPTATPVVEKEGFLDNLGKLIPFRSSKDKKPKVTTGDQPQTEAKEKQPVAKQKTEAAEDPKTKQDEEEKQKKIAADNKAKAEKKAAKVLKAKLDEEEKQKKIAADNKAKAEKQAEKLEDKNAKKLPLELERSLPEVSEIPVPPTVSKAAEFYLSNQLPKAPTEDEQKGPDEELSTSSSEIIGTNSSNTSLSTSETEILTFTQEGKKTGLQDENSESEWHGQPGVESGSLVYNPEDDNYEAGSQDTSPSSTSSSPLPKKDKTHYNPFSGATRAAKGAAKRVFGGKSSTSTSAAAPTLSKSATPLYFEEGVTPSSSPSSRRGSRGSGSFTKSSIEGIHFPSSSSSSNVQGFSEESPLRSSSSKRFFKKFSAHVKASTAKISRVFENMKKGIGSDKNATPIMTEKLKKYADDAHYFIGNLNDTSDELISYLGNQYCFAQPLEPEVQFLESGKQAIEVNINKFTENHLDGLIIQHGEKVQTEKTAGVEVSEIAGQVRSEGNRTWVSDVLTIEDNTSGKTTTIPFHAVFEGIDGRRVAKHAANQLSSVLVEKLNRIDLDDLNEVTSLLQNIFREIQATLPPGVISTKEGATGVIVLELGGRIWIATLGDCHAFIISKNPKSPKNVISLTDPQIASNSRFAIEKRKDKAKIENGKLVFSNKDSYEVLRAIGLPAHKGFGKLAEVISISLQSVSPEIPASGTAPEKAALILTTGGLRHIDPNQRVKVLMDDVSGIYEQSKRFSSTEKEISATQAICAWGLDNQVNRPDFLRDATVMLRELPHYDPKKDPMNGKASAAATPSTGLSPSSSSQNLAGLAKEEEKASAVTFAKVEEVEDDLD